MVPKGGKGCSLSVPLGAVWMAELGDVSSPAVTTIGGVSFKSVAFMEARDRLVTERDGKRGKGDFEIEGSELSHWVFIGDGN